MRLTDLNPHWVSNGGEGVTQRGEPVPRRDRIGIDFLCPCGKRQPIGDDPDDDSHRCFIPFKNPPDGGPPVYGSDEHPCWEREGDTFETLTLKPSIKRAREHGGCGWHGFITNGEVSGQVEP